MRGIRVGTWLRWLRATSTFVFIAALCLGVAVLVIALIPGSPVRQGLPVDALSGLNQIGGVTGHAVVDGTGRVLFAVDDPSLPQRLLYLLTMLPGLLLIAEIARRMAALLRAAHDGEPFTAGAAHALTSLAKVTIGGGFAVWVISQIAQGILSATMLTARSAFQPDRSLLGWLAVGLIFAAFGQIIARGVDMRTELDAVI